MGKIEAVIETRKQISVATFYVAKAANIGNLLSLSIAQELGLISLHLDKLTSKDAALDRKHPSKHSKNFSDFGKSHSRKGKKRDTDLENQDVIEKVPENGTPWVSPIVAVPPKYGHAGSHMC